MNSADASSSFFFHLSSVFVCKYRLPCVGVATIPTQHVQPTHYALMRVYLFVLQCILFLSNRTRLRLDYYYYDYVLWKRFFSLFLSLSPSPFLFIKHIFVWISFRVSLPMVFSCRFYSSTKILNSTWKKKYVRNVFLSLFCVLIASAGEWNGIATK